ncbi:subtilisin-like protease SBT1.7 [Selaginella moellendorffii]|uniref:subtilisin-like protease SBT1.7 n=1 Tax=Selaginella moellendorffii TaxID=88036 RepID=UPI000D1C659D|nr:subtilisin-like protease SBT1.7 [Selaginella moellendorffii]|eukprot:XP_024538043.1 subtilisin-like protease SBT1.7 [Selaginella moellendorffii]
MELPAMVLFIVLLLSSHLGAASVSDRKTRHSSEAVQDSMIYSYKHGMRGFAAFLTNEQADAIASTYLSWKTTALITSSRCAEKDGVLSVISNKLHKVHTTQSWSFLAGMPAQTWTGTEEWYSKKAQNVIIGMLDSGIWPESKSFHDDGMEPVPKRWRGACVPADLLRLCRKIIGARFYFKGINAEAPLNASGANFTLSARDDDGHGTHTASTAAGRVVLRASFPGNIASGTARGGAPLARLAIYKVCWNDFCSDADILAAIDDAIADGVDIISMSLGPNPPQSDFFSDTISIGSFHAMRHGIFVSCSAGNSGVPGSAANVAPWIATVGASSIDRDLASNVVLGNNMSIKVGWSFGSSQVLTWKHFDRGRQQIRTYIEELLETYFPLYAACSFCQNNTLDASKVKGNIILCLQPSALDSRPLKSLVIKQLGGVGMILVDEIAKDIAESYFLPATNVGAKEGAVIATYLNQTRQPDITAPGVSILAAWSPVATKAVGGRSVDFNIVSGTSMSCPHITGVAANLIAKFPRWSPAAIKSAIMTTASTLDNTGAAINNQFFQTVSGPFDFGAGHVRPNLSLRPGLVYDTGFHDYVSFLCSIGSLKQLHNITHDDTPCPSAPIAPHNLNYPSIAVTLQRQRKTVVCRTVTNVGTPQSLYKATVKAPSGVVVNVVPECLSFEELHEKKSFTVEFSAQASSNGSFAFGSLTWSDGRHDVTSPIAALTS